MGKLTLEVGTKLSSVELCIYIFCTALNITGVLCCFSLLFKDASVKYHYKCEGRGLGQFSFFNNL